MSNGAGGACVTETGGPRATGLGTTCVSAWGAQDLIGNVCEWTSNWYAGAGSQGLVSWPDTGYGNGDGVWNVAGQAIDGLTGWTTGIPAAAVRGGTWWDGTKSGSLRWPLRPLRRAGIPAAGSAAPHGDSAIRADAKVRPCACVHVWHVLHVML